MSHAQSNKSSDSNTVEGASCTNCFNPQCDHGKIVMKNIRTGCTSNTQVFAEPGATVYVESGETIQTHAKYSCEITPSDVKEIKEKLQCTYGRLQLPVVPWMRGANLSLEEYYIPLTLTSKHRMASHEVEGQIELENIFVTEQGNQAKRILVESQPGFGKTTLAHKLIHDWVLGKEYIGHFDLVVLVVLKHLKDKSLRDAVVEELAVERCDEKGVWTAINNAHTLLLLDGLDEIGTSAKQNILKTLCDTYSNKMTIITSCRSGLFKLESEEKDNLFRGRAMSDEFWDTRITILGLAGKDRERFLKKFVEDNAEKSKMLERINRAIAPQAAMFDSPLLLILLVFVMLENPEYKVTRRTELFKNLVDCMVKRSIGEKQWRELGEYFSLFNRSVLSNFHDMLSKFGEISLAKIIANNLQFDSNELTDAIFKMGFLKKHEIQYKLGNKVFYECFHLTFLEFAAAYSLWSEFEQNGNRFAPPTIHKVNEIRLKKDSTSTVLPFLCGLMGGTVEQFFRQFNDVSALYSLDQYLIESIFSECNLNRESYQVVEKFVPKVYECRNTSSAILKNQNYMRYIDTLRISFGSLWRLSQNSFVTVRSLVVTIESVWGILLNLNSADVAQFKSKIKCKNLYIEVITIFTTFDEIAMQLKILFCISTDHKFVLSWQLNCKNIIEKCATNNILKNQKIDFLEFHAHWNETIFDTIVNLISNNAVKEVQLNILPAATNHDEYCLDALMSNIALLEGLKSLQICNYSRGTFQCDWTKITNSGRKCWSHLSTKGVRITRTKPVSDMRINSLEMIDTDRELDVDVLLSFTPTWLHLSYQTFHFVMIKQNLETWAGLESLEGLTLTFYSLSNPLQALASLHRFNNLKRLQLNVTDGSLTQEEQSEIVDCLKEVAVDQLQLCWRETSCKSVITLMACLNDLLEKGELKSVKNIDFVLRKVNGYVVPVAPTSTDSNLDYCSLCFSALISAVMCDHKVTAHVVVYEPVNFEAVLLSLLNFIDYSQVSIEQVVRDVTFPFARYDVFDREKARIPVIVRVQQKNSVQTDKQRNSTQSGDCVVLFGASVLCS